MCAKPKGGCKTCAVTGWFIRHCWYSMTYFSFSSFRFLLQNTGYCNIIPARLIHSQSRFLPTLCSHFELLRTQRHITGVRRDLKYKGDCYAPISGHIPLGFYFWAVSRMRRSVLWLCSCRVDSRYLSFIRASQDNRSSSSDCSSVCSETKNGVTCLVLLSHLIHLLHKLQTTQN